MSDHADTIIQKQYRKGFLSMREYVRPMMMSEAFAPNEYIAACYTLVCAIPGSCGIGTEYMRMALLTETAAMSLLHMMSIIVLAMNITMMAR